MKYLKKKGIKFKKKQKQNLLKRSKCCVEIEIEYQVSAVNKTRAAIY